MSARLPTDGAFVVHPGRLLIFLQLATFALLVTSSVIRSLNSFNVLAETVLALAFVAVAIVLAAATGPFRWELPAGTEDVCSATSNPHAYSVYLLADGRSPPLNTPACANAHRSKPLPCIRAQSSAPGPCSWWF